MAELHLEVEVPTIVRSKVDLTEEMLGKLNEHLKEVFDGNFKAEITMPQVIALWDDGYRGEWCYIYTNVGGHVKTLPEVVRDFFIEYYLDNTTIYDKENMPEHKKVVDTWVYNEIGG